MISGYIVYHLYQITTIYDLVFKEAKQDLLTKCASLNQYSCPGLLQGSNETENRHKFQESASWWRRHCHEIINETEIVTHVQQLEQNVLHQSISRYQDKGHEHLHVLNQVVYWLLEHRIEGLQVSLWINLVILGMILWFVMAICLRIYREHKHKSSSSSISIHPPPPLSSKPVNVSSAYYYNNVLASNNHGLVHRRNGVIVHPLQ